MRRSPARLLPAFAIALLLASCGGGAREPRLVIVVVVDTLRADALSCYGGPPGATPNLDALAADGARFEQAVSSSGWTLPSIASILTGTWPTLHKALGKQTRLTPITADLPTAPELLQAAGFDTIAYANAAFVSPLLGLNRGFHVFDHRHAYNDRTRRADETVDAATRDLAAAERDTFLFLHLFDPHLDYDPPEDVRRRLLGGAGPPRVGWHACQKLGAMPGRGRQTVQALYAAEVTFVDEQLGRLFDALKDAGRYDEATIVVTADHGEEFWDHGGFEHGHTLYDELVRVPLIVKPPVSLVPEPADVSAQVRVLDVMPTVFEALDLEPPASFAGASLVPLMRGEDDASRIAFSESTLYGADKLSWRSDPWKYVRDRNPDSKRPEELYDWRTDPGETNNVLESNPEVAARLRAELEAFTTDLANRARTLRAGQVQDLSPREEAEYNESLEALGYTGRIVEDE